MVAHWKQVDYATYRLVAVGHNKLFNSYDALFHYCRKFGLNARQV